MTVRKQFIVRRGGKINVGVSVDSSTAQSRSKQKTDSNDQGSSFIHPGDDDEDLYVRRKVSGTCRLFDLGMALHSGVYAEIDDVFLEQRTYNPVGSHPAFVEVATVAELHAYGDTLLSKYLNGAFDTSTVLDARKPLKFDSTSIWVDVVQTDNSNVEHKTVIGTGNTRPYLVDTMHGTLPLVNGHNEGWTDHVDGGKLKIISGLKSLRVETVGYFFDFDTADTARFKFTESPSFDAVSVTPIELSSLQSIYLVPFPLSLGVSYSIHYDAGAHVGFGVNGLQRLSPYANYVIGLAVFPNNVTGATKTALIQHMVDIGLYDLAVSTEPGLMAGHSIVDRYEGTMVAAESALVGLDPAPGTPTTGVPNRLRGILRTKNHTYYVWLNSAQPYSLYDAIVVFSGFHHGVIPE